MLQPRLGPIKREAGKQEVKTGSFLTCLVKIWLAGVRNKGALLDLAQKVQHPVAMDGSADSGA